MYKPLRGRNGQLFYVLDEDAAEEMLDLQDEASEYMDTIIDAFRGLKELLGSIPMPNIEPFPKPKPKLTLNDLPLQDEQNDLPF